MEAKAKCPTCDDKGWVYDASSYGGITPMEEPPKMPCPRCSEPVHSFDCAIALNARHECSCGAINKTRIKMPEEMITFTKSEYDKLIKITLHLTHLIDATEELLEFVDEPPEKNCSCHINPPCSDCVNYSGLREALEKVRKYLK